jgi:hypothetical protein
LIFLILANEVVDSEDEDVPDDDGLPKEDEVKQTKDTIKAESPFTAHFMAIYNSVFSSLAAGEKSRANPLRSPAFLEMLHDQYMPYAFIWSGIVLRGSGDSRFTNGTIEHKYKGRKSQKSHLNQVPSQYATKYLPITRGEVLEFISFERSEPKKANRKTLLITTNKTPAKSNKRPAFDEPAEEHPTEAHGAWGARGAHPPLTLGHYQQSKRIKIVDEILTSAPNMNSTRIEQNFNITQAQATAGPFAEVLNEIANLTQLMPEIADNLTHREDDMIELDGSWLQPPPVPIKPNPDHLTEIQIVYRLQSKHVERYNITREHFANLTRNDGLLSDGVSYFN